MEKVLEYFGVFTGLLYLFLEIKQHKSMWIVGFLTSLVYVFVFFFSKIYADMGLNIYYVFISIYGFWKWSRQTSSTETTTIQPKSTILYRHLNIKLSIGLFFSLACIYYILYYILRHWTDSPIPVGDAFTTAVGIIATWMLAQRIIEHWILWVIVNLVSVYLYYLRELYPTMFLYVCYAILAIVGLYTWKKNGSRTDHPTV